MGKRLAIRGHSTRGNEVIEILEMMGGKNSRKLDGSANMYSYYIFNNTILSDRLSILEDDDFEIFTLQSFLEKYPYKVGDKAVYIDDNDIVVISEIEWDNTVGDIFYNVKRIDEDDCFLCPPEVLKPYKETNMNENKFSTANELPTFEPMFKLNDEIEYKIPDGYEITEVSKNKVFLKPIKPKYPTTYEDCCKVLGISYRAQLSYTYPDVERGNIYLTKEKHLLDAFMKLRICRNAYWKIAGEEMGLGKPWEPDYRYRNEYYSIYYNGFSIIQSNSFEAHTFIFPTEEMRDAFYENFKDLIEQCKKLL